jgi:hypothetical protein
LFLTTDAIPNELLTARVGVPLKLTHPFATLLETFVDSLVLVESAPKYTLFVPIDPPTADVLTVVTRPFVSSVTIGYAVEFPYVPAATPDVPRVPVPWLIVKSPTSVVERLAIVPVVLLRVAIVPAVEVSAPPKVPPVMLAVVEFSVPIVPDVAITDVEFVVPEDRFVIVPRVEVVVPAVRFGIVPVVIVPVVLIVLFAETVPTLRTLDKFMFVYVPEDSELLRRFWTEILLGAIAASTFIGAISISSAVLAVVTRSWFLMIAEFTRVSLIRLFRLSAVTVPPVTKST